MKTLYCLLFGILSFSSMSTAFAHDDGLTCHTHPPPSRFSSILITSYQLGGGGAYDIYLEEARHRFDNAYSSETCHPFHVKAATQTGAKLPPIGA